MQGGVHWRVKEEDEETKKRRKDKNKNEDEGSVEGEEEKVKPRDKPSTNPQPRKMGTSKERLPETPSKSAQEPSPMLQKSQNSNSKKSEEKSKKSKKSKKSDKSKKSKKSKKSEKSKKSQMPVKERRAPSKAVINARNARSRPSLMARRARSKQSTKVRQMATARHKASTASSKKPVCRQIKTAVGKDDPVASICGSAPKETLDTSAYKDVDVDIIAFNKIVAKKSNVKVTSKKKSQVGDVDSGGENSATQRSWPDMNLEVVTENKMFSKKSNIKSNNTTAKEPDNKPEIDPIRTRDFPKAPKMDYKAFIQSHFMEPGPGPKNLCYSPQQYYRVLGDAAEVLKDEPALVDVCPPVHIVGDIHGQFNDLIAMFSILGTPPEQKYLFLGDYVDRGKMSVEVMLLLFAYKAQYPNSIYLLRGNHECARINNRYGFLRELELKQGTSVHSHLWALCQKVFDLLPVCALVATRILCMHGGISPGLTDFDKMRMLQKPIRNPSKGVVNDLLWADPETGIGGWKKSTRGSGVLFGHSALNDFCERMDIDLVVRAHQVCLDGFYITPDFRLVTLFSAPMYCGLLRNAGATMFVNEELAVTIHTFVPESNGICDRINYHNKVWDNEVDCIPDPMCL